MDNGWRRDLAFTFLLTTAASLAGFAYVRFNGRPYIEGMPLFFLVFWALLSCVILIGMRWERRRGRGL